MKEKPPMSLGCSFRELLLCCDPIEVSTKAALRDYEAKSFDNDDDAIEFLAKQMSGYRNAIDEIVSYPNNDKRPMGFVLRLVDDDEFSDRDWINVGLWNYDFIGYPPDGCDWKEYEKHEHVQTYSASFSEWSEHPDREVLLDDGSAQFCHALSDIAAELMWEVTWGGFTGKETAETGEEVLGTAQAAKDAYFAGKKTNE